MTLSKRIKKFISKTASFSTSRIKTIQLFGKPLTFAEAHTQLLTVWLGLAILSSDALSSVAYATDQIFFVLWSAGPGFLHLSLPIAIGIVALLAAVTISYRQTIFTYTNGGGAYIVAKDNFKSINWALIAAASLLIDYVLTVSVSVTSGVEQVVSAFPWVRAYQLELNIFIILAIAYFNLRGIKEAGKAFAVPTYLFIGSVILTVAVGVSRYTTGHLGHVTDVVPVTSLMQPIGVFLILRAIANGCTAMTGVEAISNGIPYFQEPKPGNAARAMALMSSILGVMFVGITFLAVSVHAIPSNDQTIISQIGHVIWGNTIMYDILIFVTTFILILAANTSYAGLPQLAALLATDGHMPRQLSHKGIRLAYNNGIIALTVFAIALIIIFKGHTTLLIPLYAIGVFLGFTISQVGMVAHWKKKIKRAKKSTFSLQLKLSANLIGAILTAIVLVIFVVTKFSEGAWITVITIPVLLFMFHYIRRHYHITKSRLLDDLHEQILQLRALHKNRRSKIYRTEAIVLIDRIDKSTIEMLKEVAYDRIPYHAIHIQEDEGKTTKKLQKEWKRQVGFLGKNLEILMAPHRDIIKPIISHIRHLTQSNRHIRYRVYVGHLILENNYIDRWLHQNTAATIVAALRGVPHVTIAASCYHLRNNYRWFLRPQENPVKVKEY